MELQQLRYIVALSQERNFIRAAKRVHVTQPTLSHQIKKLEDEIGHPLFERSAKGVSLTPAGEKFIPCAVSTLDHLERGLKEIQVEAQGISGKIAIGAIPTISPYLIPDILIKVRKEAPRLSLEFYEETTSILLESVKAGKLDLGILSTPVTDSGIVSRAVGKEEFYLATSKKHPLSKQKHVSLKMIQREKLLILQEGHCFSDQMLDYCKQVREDAQVIFQGSSLTSVMKLASVGEGLTLVPRMAVNDKENPNLAFIPFSSPKPTREIGIVWRVSAPLTPAHRFLMDTITETFHRIHTK